MTASLPFFLTVGDMKLFRDCIFDKKEHKEMVLKPEQEEMVPGHYEEFSNA